MNHHRLGVSFQDRQASVIRRRPFTVSKWNISEPCGPILIKLNVNHHWLGVSFHDRQASVIRHRLFTISKRNISEKYNVKHHWLRRLIALGFRADCVKIVVSMATDSSHKLTMGNTIKLFFFETTKPRASIFCM